MNDETKPPEPIRVEVGQTWRYRNDINRANGLHGKTRKVEAVLSDDTVECADDEETTVSFLLRNADLISPAPAPIAPVEPTLPTVRRVAPCALIFWAFDEAGIMAQMNKHAGTCAECKPKPRAQEANSCFCMAKHEGECRCNKPGCDLNLHHLGKCGYSRVEIRAQEAKAVVCTNGRDCPTPQAPVFVRVLRDERQPMCDTCYLEYERGIKYVMRGKRIPPAVASSPGELLPKPRMLADNTWDLLPEAGR